jgi:hypothetical protein
MDPSPSILPLYDELAIGEMGLGDHAIFNIAISILHFRIRIKVGLRKQWIHVDVHSGLLSLLIYSRRTKCAYSVEMGVADLIPWVKRNQSVSWYDSRQPS